MHQTKPVVQTEGKIIRLAKENHYKHYILISTGCENKAIQI